MQPERQKEALMFKLEAAFREITILMIAKIQRNMHYETLQNCTKTEKLQLTLRTIASLNYTAQPTEKIH